MKYKKVILLTGLIALSCMACGKQTKHMSHEEQVKNNQILIKKTSYAAETNYVGSLAPAELYNIPFAKSVNYIPNKKVVKELDQKMLKAYLSTSIEYANFIFGNNYRSILENQEAFIEKYMSFALNNEDTAMQVQNSETSVREQATKLQAFYIDNKTEIESSFVTDQSLVYESGYQVRVRGSLTLKPYNKSSSLALKERYGIKLDPGEEGSYLTEILFLSKNTTSVVGVEIIVKIGE